MTAAEQELRAAVVLAVEEGMSMVEITNVVWDQFEKETPGEKG